MDFTPINNQKYIPAMFIGDIHGSMSDFDKAVNMALRNGVENAIFVGDFWLYDDKELLKAEKVISRNCKQFGANKENFKVYFIDGNHENFFQLAEYMVNNGVDFSQVYGKAASEGIMENLYQDYDGRKLKTNLRPINMSHHEVIEIAPNFFYAPRGSVIEIDNTTIGFLGGAFSIDYKMRTDGKDWFSLEEVINENDVDFAIKNFAKHKNIDIFVTHDTVNNSGLNSRLNHLSNDFLAEINSDTNLSQKKFLSQVKDTINPSICVHGHYHTPYVKFVDNDNNDVTKDFYNVGLGKNSEYGSFAILPKLDTYALNYEDKYGIHLLGFKDTVFDSECY